VPATILITGAAGGIGTALSAQFAARGDQVIAVCRRSSDALAALPVEVIEAGDLTRSADLAALVGKLHGRRLDGLVLNAGLLASEHLGALDEDAIAGIRRQFEINALTPLRLVDALLPQLASPARIALITSRMGSIGDNGSGGYYGYRMSKAAMNAMGKSLAHDLAPRGIAVVLLHPGYVQTPMTGGRGDSTPAQSAAGLIARYDALDAASSGRFFHANGSELPW
jgi:NAD(P)-dependent dehydrogenase (short-subunit alcohol dehydrogenase family)